MIGELKMSDRGARRAPLLLLALLAGCAWLAPPPSLSSLELVPGAGAAAATAATVRGQSRALGLHFVNATPPSLAGAPANQQQHQQQSVAVGVAAAAATTTTTTQKPNYLETGRQITGILDRFMSLGYDKRVRPNYGGPPVEVNVTMRILSISSVSEVMMDFTADFYFRQTWHDPRLSFKKLGDIQTLYVGAEVSKKIWLPDTFFGNEKMAYFHEATTPNVFLRIDHSGEVYRSIRLTVTSSCPMNLQYFPMDRQRCTIEAESYGYNVRDIIYRWAHSTAVERDKEISLPQFDIVQTVQKYRLEELSSGTYSRLIAELHFARRMGYYLIQIYIPSSLIVVISWVSFWLHRNASPARVQLGVTTVLTMTTLMSSTNAALPKISYVKSIDIFLGTCFVMVFAALLEYATVGYLGKRIAMRKAHAQHAQAQAQAKLFAQLQAQGAEGDSVPLAEVAAGLAAPAAAPFSHAPALPPPPPPHPAHASGSPQTGAAGLAPGNLGLFGNAPDHSTSSSTRFQQQHYLHQHQLLSGQDTPLSVLLSDPNLLSAVAAAAAAAAAGASGHSTSQTSEHHMAQERRRPHKDRCQCDARHAHNTCHRAHESCDSHHHALQHQQPAPSKHCAHHNGHHIHSQQPQAHARACSLHRDANEPASKSAQLKAYEPQAPPRRIFSHKCDCHCAGCECQHANNPTTAAADYRQTSNTLPRNATFLPSSSGGGTGGCCAHRHQEPQPQFHCVDSLRPRAHTQPQPQPQQLQQPPLSTQLHLPAHLRQMTSPSKGAASAAAVAAATFVNLHRKKQGLPPSTNPNFAPFAGPPLGPHDRHLETIFGIRPSDIDKYSRVVFPVCFVCFQLMYWIVYLHISAFLEPDQQQQQSLQPPLLPPLQPPSQVIT